MALTNQPYLPLYVDDWMNNTKLKMCSPAAHGVMISIMSIMHKEATYGKILLKQKFKQTDKQIQNFALQVAKVSAFDFAEIESPLTELISEGVLIIDGDFMICKRMVRDGEISEARSKAGKNGGVSNKNKNFAYAKDEPKPLANNQANSEANSVIENGSVIENVIVVESEVATVDEKKQIDYEKVVSIFNSICNRLPAVQKLTPQRKATLKNRISEVGLTGVGDVFQKVSQSRFLNGENDRGWTADFDWILKPANFIKIIEGKYNNKDNGNGNSNSGFKTVSGDFAGKILEGLQSE